MEKIRILFVCMGNICRSPTAQGVFSALVRREGLADWIAVDSAGTHDYHMGKMPDERARGAALRRGIDISGQRARIVTEDDFYTHDYILAMDYANAADLMAMCPPEHADKVGLFLSYAPGGGQAEVPDPYYGGPTGFERVLDLIEQGAEGLLADIRFRYRL
jgi:protein-tyrosine phosphatase